MFRTGTRQLQHEVAVNEKQQRRKLRTSNRRDSPSSTPTSTSATTSFPANSTATSANTGFSARHGAHQRLKIGKHRNRCRSKKRIERNTSQRRSRTSPCRPTVRRTTAPPPGPTSAAQPSQRVDAGPKPPGTHHVRLRRTWCGNDLNRQLRKQPLEN